LATELREPDWCAFWTDHQELGRYVADSGHILAINTALPDLVESGPAANEPGGDNDQERQDDGN
jgi:hypothetical protein